MVQSGTKTLTITQHRASIEVVARSTFIFVTFVSSVVVTLSTVRRTSYKSDIYTFWLDSNEIVFLTIVTCPVLMQIVNTMQTIMGILRYYELYNSEQSILIHNDTNEEPEIETWEVEAALQDMKNGTVTGNDHINIDTLKAGDGRISKALAKRYTKCFSERRTPTAWKNAKMMIIFKKRNTKDLKNYRPLCLL